MFTWGCEMQSTKALRKTLVRNGKIPDRQLEDFILEVVNAPDREVDGSDDYLAQKYRPFFPTRDRDIQLLGEVLSRFRDPNHPAPKNRFDQKEAREMLRRGVIGDLRNRLREVWLAKDDVAEWRICMLQLHAHLSTNLEDQRSRRLYPPSPDTPIELAIDWARRNLSRRRVCRNPDCSRPYFVVSSARRCLCSDACIAATQKAHKRRWWKDKKGSQLYKQRSKQKSIERETMEPLAVSGGANIGVSAGEPT